MAKYVSIIFAIDGDLTLNVNCISKLSDFIISFFSFRACQAVSDANLQGVCYTKQECDDLGGEEDGNCAAGFGTCCIVK